MNQFEIKNFTVDFPEGNQRMHVVDGVELAVAQGEAVGIVGASGSGKTLTILAALGLLDRDDSHISGRVFWQGNEITPVYDRNSSVYEAMMQEILGNRIALVFQNASAALHPLVRMDKQMIEGIRAHHKISKKQALELADFALQQVGIDEAKTFFKKYPYQLSGGMQQRSLIAMALMSKPELLIADEPTASLDATHQMEMVRLLRKKNQEGMSLLVITHDLGVVAALCQRMYVFDQGRIVEEGRIEDVFLNPKQAYTKQMLSDAHYMDGE